MDLSSASEKALQKLGFLAQTPANYDEYYVTQKKGNTARNTNSKNLTATHLCKRPNMMM
jgi:hypothetical protein